MPRISHGCHACRKRKIKCSEEKPACQKCIDFKIECPGYDRKAVKPNFRFKDQTERFSRASPNDSSSQMVFSAGAQPYDNPNHEVIKHPFSSCPLSSEIPSSSVWQMQAFSNFLDVYLPHDDSWKSFSHFKYMTLLPTIARNHPALMSAMDAISTAQLGTIRKDTSLLRNSLSAYGRSLFQLNKALAAPETAQMDESLACIIILGLCEVSNYAIFIQLCFCQPIDLHTAFYMNTLHSGSSTLCCHHKVFRQSFLVFSRASPRYFLYTF